MITLLKHWAAHMFILLRKLKCLPTEYGINCMFSRLAFKAPHNSESSCLIFHFNSLPIPSTSFLQSSLFTWPCLKLSYLNEFSQALAFVWNFNFLYPAKSYLKASSNLSSSRTVLYSVVASSDLWLFTCKVKLIQVETPFLNLTSHILLDSTCSKKPLSFTFSN